VEEGNDTIGDFRPDAGHGHQLFPAGIAQIIEVFKVFGQQIRSLFADMADAERINNARQVR
jgi:hypothetical protein